MRILIVEDNMELAALLYECLISYFSDYISYIGKAHDGQEAIDMIIENEPQIVLLDIIMPKIDGIGVLMKIKELDLRYKPNVIVLSAVGKDSLAKQAMSLGADYFIQKPFNMQSIVSLILKIQGY